MTLRERLIVDRFMIRMGHTRVVLGITERQGMEEALETLALLVHLELVKKVKHRPFQNALFVLTPDGEHWKREVRRAFVK